MFVSSSDLSYINKKLNNPHFIVINGDLIFDSYLILARGDLIFQLHICHIRESTYVLQKDYL